MYMFIYIYISITDLGESKRLGREVGQSKCLQKGTTKKTLRSRDKE